MVFRRLLEEENFGVAAINAGYTPEQLAHLIKYDSVHGTLPCEIACGENYMIINGNKIAIANSREPEKLPWGELGIDLVVESTGAFRTKETCEKHLIGGAKKVVLTAPAKDDMKMIVMGVNESSYDDEKIVSNASCTTNALAPLAKILDEEFGIINGLMTTVHSYTNDQKNLDNPHKDLRRARACGLSMIPTSTGAAKAVGKVLPNLEGKLNGLAIRVPTPDVSLVDLVIDVEKEVTKDQVNNVLEKASSRLRGILGYSEEPLVSIDYTTNSHSTIVDGLSTMVIGKNKIKVLAWYDNEWGYSCRVVDLAKYIM
jgi:glyceraldehyde 3-phosphate dehydrogenase